MSPIQTMTLETKRTSPTTVSWCGLGWSNNATSVTYTSSCALPKQWPGNSSRSTTWNTTGALFTVKASWIPQTHDELTTVCRNQSSKQNVCIFVSFQMWMLFWSFWLFYEAYFVLKHSFFISKLIERATLNIFLHDRTESNFLIIYSNRKYILTRKWQINRNVHFKKKKLMSFWSVSYITCYWKLIWFA